MKKITALLLLFAILFGCTTMLLACAPAEPPVYGPGDEDNEDDKNDDTSDDAPPSASAIVVPTYKDYERGTVDFAELTYSRPDVDKLCRDFMSASEAVRMAGDEAKVEEAIALIKMLEEPYATFKTMSTLSEIRTYQNSANIEWATEYEYLSVARSSVAQAVEALLVAAAQSDFIEKYETDYFGYEIDEYSKGGIYTDAVVALMSEEAALVAEYNGISTATVELYIAQYDERGTYDELMAAAAEKYGTGSMQYMMRSMLYGQAYNAAITKLNEEIHINLLKKRKEIANALGLNSYAEFMYDQMGYDYTPEDMKKFLGNIKGTIYEVYTRLLNELYYHLSQESAPSLGRTQLINTLYSVYLEADTSVADVYAYMLQHGLYDISGATANRYEGAFTAYITSNSSPFLFASTVGDITDYSTVSHEFGHFYDSFVNYDGNSSLELCEVSSQALEYITLNLLKDKLGQSGYTYMTHLYVYNALTTMIYQSLYSLYEHMAYELDYDEITIDNLNALVTEACTIITGSNQMLVSIYGETHEKYDSIHDVLVPHIIVAPLYVQSYVTSLVPALEIYFKELNKEGDGLAIYKALVEDADEDKSFTDHLTDAGLSTPFDEGILDSVASALYKQIFGVSYSTGGGAAA